MSTASTGQQTEHQPHAGAGIAAVEDLSGFLKAIETDSLHRDRAARDDRTDADPHRSQAGGGAEGILRRKQPFDGCRAFRYGPEQQ